MQAIEEHIGTILNEKKLTIAIAESCTGGLIGHRLTNISGSSDYVTGGIIAYSNDVKVSLLQVSQEIIANEGAVCEEVAIQMARGAKEVLNADIGVGVTGIAGPSGGTEQKPVGLVYIAASFRDKQISEKIIFSGDRESIKWQTSEEALKMALRLIES